MALAAALTVAGCAAPPPKDPTAQEENALATAGFNLKMADTPAKRELIQKLPQRRLAQGEVQGRQVYVWADAPGCQCWYSGHENAYRRLIDQRREQKIGQRSYWYQDQGEGGKPGGGGGLTIITLTNSDLDIEGLGGSGSPPH